MIEPRPPPGSRRDYEDERLHMVIAKASPWILSPPLSFAKQLRAAGVDPDKILAPDFPVALVTSKVDPPATTKGGRFLTAELVGVHVVLHLVLDNGGRMRYYPLLFCGRTEASRNRVAMLLKTDVGHGCRLYLAEQGPHNINIEPDPVVVHAPALQEMMRSAEDPKELVDAAYCPACHPDTAGKENAWTTFWSAP